VQLYGLDDKALNHMLVGNHIALGLMNIICIFFLFSFVPAGYVFKYLDYH
jgi:hypothetical protein